MTQITFDFFDPQNSPLRKYAKALRFSFLWPQASTATLILPDWTQAAYNERGGGSLYYIMNKDFERGAIREEVARFVHASVDRNSKASGDLHSPEAFAHIVESLLKRGERLRICGMQDLESGSCSLNGSALEKPLIFLGHNEYWTQNIYKKIEKFSNNGGNVLNFSANIAWWLVNKDSNNNISVYKSFTNDREKLRETSIWHKTGLGRKTYRFLKERPEYTPSSLVGISYQTAGYPLSRFEKTLDESSDESKVTVLCQHPIFEGLPLQNKFLEEVGVIHGSKELDGVWINDDSTMSGDHYMPAGSEIYLIASAMARKSASSLHAVPRSSPNIFQKAEMEDVFCLLAASEFITQLRKIVRTHSNYFSTHWIILNKLTKDKSWLHAHQERKCHKA